MDASSVYDWNEECVPTGRGQEDRGKKKWEVPGECKAAHFLSQI